MMRVGIGYDVHRLVEDRKLILGGIEIPYEKGLLGHSDADVLTHAIMDSLLGAAGLGDIGKQFPDTDEKYYAADSIELLKKVKEMIEKECYVIGNIDATIVAQRPKLASYIPQIVARLAMALNITEKQVNIKATTEEGLGFTGSEEAISSQAICMLDSIENYAYMASNQTVYSYDPEEGIRSSQSTDMAVTEKCCSKRDFPSSCAKCCMVDSNIKEDMKI